ncbi:MAG TPA: class I SAM-dependent methyltransferase [Ferruginibacter sp.]|nr:class I SAM-dependent methyltransferase [Ferruginibacter sp.]
MNNIAAYPAAENFEKLYTRLRRKEGRMYADEEVMLLPIIHNAHPLLNEWRIRKNSCRALLGYIKQRDNIVSVLEVGCGNGWLSAKIAGAADVEVTGIDVNTPELEQAKRVFKKIPGLHFINTTLQAEELKEKKFDMILFAASIQYFPSLKEVVTLALEKLTLQGEIHIMDSPFYGQPEIEPARQRSKEHFNRMGFPEMAGHYFHHSIAELDDFQYKILHHPHSWKNKLSIKKNPFYWITIKNRYS